MARIRTIKPEFPHSESMGRVSRDARLLFILLWTLCDDSGVTRGSSRILASLLYPYDDDAKKLIDKWIAELETENSIARYVVDGHTYLKVLNWSSHQKIDKPTPSRLPPFDESSRITRESSRGVAKSSDGIGSGPSEGSGPRPGSTGVPLFDPNSIPGLNQTAWAEWIAYRADRKPAIKPKSYPKAAAEMAKLGAGQQAAVDYSIANTYQGLIEPKTSGNGRAHDASTSAKDAAAWAEARSAARAIGFREPIEHETASSYLTAVNLAKNRPPPTAIADRIGLAGIKRIPT
jgi:hypothetical protein